MAEAGKINPRPISWDKATCTGCMSCVVVCSERHTGMAAPNRSRIHIVINPLRSTHVGNWCRQCKKAKCAEACPVNAIQFNQQVGAWIVDEALCTNCGSCVEACPFHYMQLDPATDIAMKCDLCLGATHCVEVCPSSALTVKERK
jgi:anaerobic carbon-monoxide dehydrogenase iron sulfur subunit